MSPWTRDVVSAIPAWCNQVALVQRQARRTPPPRVKACDLAEEVTRYCLGWKRCIWRWLNKLALRGFYLYVMLFGLALFTSMELEWYMYICVSLAGKYPRCLDKINIFLLLLLNFAVKNGSCIIEENN